MCVECALKTSVTAGTIFHRSHTPLSTWFAAVWFVTSQKNGVAHQSVQSAAADAARSASIARTQGGAQTAGDTAAATSLTNQHVNCTATTVSVDTTGFASPVGTPAKITATVTCHVNLSDLLPGVPGSKVITAAMSSPLDTYRERR